MSDDLFMELWHRKFYDNYFITFFLRTSSNIEDEAEIKDKFAELEVSLEVGLSVYTTPQTEEGFQSTYPASTSEVFTPRPPSVQLPCKHPTFSIFKREPLKKLNTTEENNLDGQYLLSLLPFYKSLNSLQKFNYQQTAATFFQTTMHTPSP